jgi:hypothetical protein
MHDLIYHKDTLYVIKRKIRVSQMDPELKLLKAWKDYLNVDHVLKKKDYFLLCNTVKEPQIISETIN